MQLQLITPEKILFSGEIDMVTAPGSEGEFGVLQGHAPFVSTLKPGVIRIDLPDNQKRRMAVLSGFAEVTPERCIILAETAQDCSNVTPSQAEANLVDARRRVDDAITDDEKKSAAQALALAEAVARAA